MLLDSIKNLSEIGAIMVTLKVKSLIDVPVVKKHVLVVQVERRSHRVSLISESFADDDWSSYRNHNLQVRVVDFIRYMCYVLKFNLSHVNCVRHPPIGLANLRLLCGGDVFLS